MPEPADPREALPAAPSDGAPLAAWELRVLEEMPAHREVEIPRFPTEDIRGRGYRESIGEPRGQDGDYRRPLEDGRGLHLKDYGDRMTLHWDKVDPSVSRIRHLLYDATAITAGSLVVGAAGLATLRSILRSRS